MSTPANQMGNIGATVANTALVTAQALMPVILAGIAAGQAASNPQAATIAALAPVIVSLIQSGAAGTPELTSYMTALAGSIQTETAQIDAAAAARGVTVTQP